MISSDLISGFLKGIILITLKNEGPLHGYALAKKIEELSGNNIKISNTSIYPALHKFKKEKIVDTVSDITTGRMRVFYALTPKGHSLATKKTQEFQEFINSVRKLITLKPAADYQSKS